MTKIKYLLVLLISTTLWANTNVIERDGLKYFSDVVIVKFKSSHSTLSKTSHSKTVLKQLNSFGVTDVVKLFNPMDERGESEINSIYQLKFTSPLDPIYLSAKLSKLREVEWAEPQYLRKTFDTPNDPKFSQQYGLTKVQASAAWDITKGNSNIIIAIVDSGVEWTHEDLKAHIWNNSDEVLDGTDSDGNGYIDDIRGWDLGGFTGTGDNNPIEDSPTHGTHVAGIASAVTNNSVGVAGLGYNTTIMPVKVSRHDLGDDIISDGYDGIIYAADNGADVINCSWGGSGYSRAEQTAIDYAVAKGAVIVAAAGNDGIDKIIYPAAYKGVLSVGSTDQNDRKSSFSNYGIGLDVCAPGSSIYNTWQGSTSSYTTLSGTSMASPLVAGLAALVVDKYPNYTPLQIIEQIRVTSESIDNLNTGKENMLGHGRINAYKAVTSSDEKSVRIVSSEFIDVGNKDGIIESGDEVEINLSFVNHLKPLSSFSAVLTTKSSDVTITQSQFSTTAKQTFEEFGNMNNKFRFKVNQNSGNDKEILFKLTYTDGTYSDFELISVYINPTYKTQSGNNISFTITSKGTLAFNDYPTNTNGDGFTYMKGKSLLFEAGLMYGIAKTKVMSSVRDATADNQSNQFSPLSFVQIDNPGEIADQQGFSMFNDDAAGTKKLGIKTELRTFSFSDEGNENYIILEYTFKNNSGTDYSDFYTGIYFDWDIDDEGYAQNRTKYDSQNNFGYAYHTDTDKPFIGMALLTSGATGFYGIQNDGKDGGVGVYDGFPDVSKWKTLTNGLNKTDVGPTDVSCVISSGTHNFKANSTLVVAFSISAGIDLASIQNSVVNSRAKYSVAITDVVIAEPNLPTEYLLLQNYPNPFNPSTTIEYSIPQNTKREVANVKLVVYNSLGQKVATLVNKEQRAGSYETVFDASNLASGFYFYKLIVDNFVDVKKMILLK